MQLRVVRSAPSPTNKLLRVLLLEDSETDAELIASELQRSGMKPVVERVDSPESFTAALHSFAPIGRSVFETIVPPDLAEEKRRLFTAAVEEGSRTPDVLFIQPLGGAW